MCGQGAAAGAGMRRSTAISHGFRVWQRSMLHTTVGFPVLQSSFFVQPTTSPNTTLVSYTQRSRPVNAYCAVLLQRGYSRISVLKSYPVSGPLQYD